MIHIFLSSITTQLCWWISKNPSFILWSTVAWGIVFAFITYMYIKAKKQQSETHNDYLRVNDENTSNISKIKSLESNVNDICREWSSAKRKVADLQEQLDMEKLKEHELKDKLENIQKNIAQLRIHLSNEQNITKNLSKELCTRNDEIQSLQQQIFVLEEACTHTKTQKENELKSERGKTEELKIKNNGLLSQLSLLYTQMEKKQEEVSTLTEELNTAKSDNFSLKQKIKDIESSLKEKDIILLERGDKMSELVAYISKIELILAESKSVIEKKDREIADKITEIKEKCSELSAKNRIIDATEIKIKKLKSQIASFSSISSKIEELEKERKVLIEQLEAANLKLILKNKNLKEQTKLAKERSTEIERITEEFHKANESINTLRKRIIELSTLLDASTESIKADEVEQITRFNSKSTQSRERDIEGSSNSNENISEEILSDSDATTEMSIYMPEIGSGFCKFNSTSILQHEKKSNTRCNENKPRSLNVIHFSSFSGNRILPNTLNFGKRVANSKKKEPDVLEYIGEVNTIDISSSDIEPHNYPCFISPMSGTHILNYHTYGHVTGGVTEPLLYHSLISLKEIVPDIDIIQNISIPVRGRNYGYKPDIAVIWKQYNIYIDIEIDEPYDIVSRKPIHYKTCSDNIRNSYLVENGWFVIRFAEEQIVRNIEGCRDAVSALLYQISNVQEIYKEMPNFEKKRWTYEEAKNMESEKIRESYLGIEIENDTIELVDTYEEDNYCIPDEFEFRKPEEDIFGEKYDNLRTQILSIANNNNYIIIKNKETGYEYVTKKDDISYVFNNARPSISLCDSIEKKTYTFPLCDVDSFWGESEILENISEEYHNFIYDCMVNCYPINITYNTSDAGCIRERTILYLSPSKSKEILDKYKSKYRTLELIESLASCNYKTSIETNFYNLFCGYCLLKKDLRTFYGGRIQKAAIYRIYKPAICYDEEIWNMLEKGNSILAEIIYSHLPSIKKNRLCYIVNHCNALVMQSKYQEVLKIYKQYDKDEYIPEYHNNLFQVCLNDIDYFIENDIHKTEFLKMKELLKEVWL